jgi:hypothetical protein
MMDMHDWQTPYACPVQPSAIQSLSSPGLASARCYVLRAPENQRPAKGPAALTTAGLGAMK